jgi:phage shock protein A
MRDSYEAVISDHELEQQLSKMKEQLKEAEQDRQKLRHQIEQLSSHVEILKAEQPQK